MPFLTMPRASPQWSIRPLWDDWCWSADHRCWQRQCRFLVGGFLGDHIDEFRSPLDGGRCIARSQGRLRAEAKGGRHNGMQTTRSGWCAELTRFLETRSLAIIPAPFRTSIAIMCTAVRWRKFPVMTQERPILQENRGRLVH